LEAWSCGVPVAARKAPGNNELLGKAPSDIAMLFHEQSDFNPLLNWLSMILNQDAATHRERVHAAAAHIRLHHAEQDEIRDLLEVYRGILG
ncbi:MAG: hypothetical protein Q8P24_13975, partial [Desulfobacterales bacterium]|nr:hypothetical protein [Desulfobacterales bacterium]